MNQSHSIAQRSQTANLAKLLTAAGFVALCAVGHTAAEAATNLVVNGNFETNGGVGQLSGGITSIGTWTVGPVVVTPNTPPGSAPFDFILNGNADISGFPSVFSPPNIYLWGPRTPVSAGGPVANGFTTSADGGFFFGSDGGYATAPISQTIAGLTIGNQYTLSFEYAGAQFSQYFGATQQSWQVTFGSTVVTTPTLAVASQGFSGWRTFTTTFTATSASQVLTFLAKGTPVGIPPTTLIDGIQLVAAVPEPGTYALMLAGLGLVGFLARKTRRA
jgi:hypothetical protein